MADLSVPVGLGSETTLVPQRLPERFAFSLSEEEKSRQVLPRALCLRAVFLCLLTYCVYSAACVISAGRFLIGNQWENTYPEAPHIFAAIRSAQTHRLYFPFTQKPYVLQSYGPLFYEMYYWMARAVHADVDRFVHLARITDFFCFLACGALVFAICRRLRFSALASLAAAALPMGVPLFCNGSATTRPDMYFLAAMLVSLAIAVWRESPGVWVCLAAGAAGGVAFLLKQPGMAVLIAMGIVWLLHKKFRQTVFVALGAALPVVAMLALLLWHKEDFVGQFFSVGKAIWSLNDGLLYTETVLKSATILLPIAIGVIGFVRAVTSGERAQLLASFTLVNWGVGLSGMPQSGSAGNYFFGGLLGCGLLLPYALEFAREKVKFAPLLLLAAAGLCYLTYGYSFGGTLAATNLSPNPYEPLHTFKILSDRPEFSLHGRDADLLDPISIHTVEVGSGLWSSAPVEESVRRLDYDLVILTCSGGSRVICNFRGINFFGSGVVAAMNQNYSVFCTSQNAIVLTPRTRHVDVTPGMLDAALGAPCETRFQGHAPDLLIMAGTR